MSEAKSLEQILGRGYRFNVIADPEGGYVIVYPDLPGCMTQVESIGEVSETASEIRELWIETAFEQGLSIPEPTFPESYSGKFNVRLPKSLHRRLAERAEMESVSLNQLVVSLLSSGIERRELIAQIGFESGPFATDWSETWEKSWRVAEGSKERASRAEPVVRQSRVTPGERVFESPMPSRSPNVVTFPAPSPVQDDELLSVFEEIAV